MHELGIVFHILDSATAVAKENGVGKIERVVVEVGEVSTVIPEYLVDCWNWAIKKRGPLFQGCALEVETIPAITHCDGCGEEYPTIAHGRVCPHCGSERTWLLVGNELNIKELAVLEE